MRSDPNRVEDTCRIFEMTVQKSKTEFSENLRRLVAESRARGCHHVTVTACDAELCALLQATADAAVDPRRAEELKNTLRDALERLSGIEDRRIKKQG